MVLFFQFVDVVLSEDPCPGVICLLDLLHRFGFADCDESDAPSLLSRQVVDLRADQLVFVVDGHFAQGLHAADL